MAILGWHKIIIGGGGLPNTWYFDDLPHPKPFAPPQGGCLVACNATGCEDPPMLQIFDLEADEAERHNLAPTANASLLASMMAVVQKYNDSHYAEPLFYSTPLENGTGPRCPFVGEDGVLTPCSV